MIDASTDTASGKPSRRLARRTRRRWRNSGEHVEAVPFRTSRHPQLSFLNGGESLKLISHLDAETSFPVAYPKRWHVQDPSQPAHFAARVPIQSRQLKYLPSMERNIRSASPSPVLDSPLMSGQINTSNSAPRVSIDHFDPEGVLRLSRTLSQSSGGPGLRSVRSDGTLAPDEPFSLEKTLRATFDKYAI